LENTFFHVGRLDLIISCRDADLGTVHGLARFEAMHKDGEALLAREHPDEFVIWCHGQDPRSHAHVEWRRLIVVVALVGERTARENSQEHGGKRLLNWGASAITRPPDGLRPSSFRHHFSKPVSQ
jgi:hypothetical protein